MGSTVGERGSVMGRILEKVCLEFKVGAMDGESGELVLKQLGLW